MDIGQIIKDYFVDPVVERTGYNIVNTIVYATIALVAAYLIYLYLKPRFGKRFLLHIIPFILFGSTMRVVTDIVDSGIKDEGIVGSLIKSGIYNYGFVTATPGIYIITAVVVIISIFISDKFNYLKIWRRMIPTFPLIGALLFVFHFLLIILFFKNYSFFLLIVGIAIASLAIGWIILKRMKIDNVQSKIAIFSHALDGAAAFVAVDVFSRIAPECINFGKCYFEQHVFGRFVGGLGDYGMLIFLLIKVIFAIAACYVIERESKDEKEKNFIYLLVIIFGLAPGFRSSLRLLTGA